MAAMDRVSELPEPILHHILSFLSQKEAIQTSALSKTWRHVGPTRPKIELREGCFKKSSRASLLTELGKTFQRYYHQNLSVDEFIFEMSSSESDYPGIDSEFTNDPGKTIFKGLKRLSLKMVHIKDDETLEKIVRSCSLIEYLNVSDCKGLKTIPLNIFEAEFLTELHLTGRDLGAYGLNLIVPTDQLLLIKRLKTLTLERVYILEETLDKIMCSCSLIEYLLLSNCFGLKTIPETIFQAEFLTELHLSGRNIYAYGQLRGLNLIFTTDQLLLIKRLKTLSLEWVNIAEETLDKIMCSCPLIQRLILTDCMRLTNVQLIKNNNNNLKHFSCSFYGGHTESLAIQSPTIETIRIEKCSNWYGQDKYIFTRLKSLCLNRVKLFAELFESFSSNFPSLEDLQLEYCYGLEEIQLTVSSIKRLVLMSGWEKLIKATIYAPNIHYFMFSGHYLPQLIFTGGEWKSHLDLRYGSTLSDNKALIQLSQLLNSLRESQITLDLYSKPLENLKVEDTNDAGFCNPVPVEYVRVHGSYESCSFPDLLNGLFLICRPKYIGIILRTINPATDFIRAKDKLAELITFKTIRNEGERDLWEIELEEISMHVWDKDSQGIWHIVHVEGTTSFPVFTSPILKIKLSLRGKPSSCVS